MRKLATAAFSFAAAVFVSHYLLTDGWTVALFFACAALSVPAAVFLRGDKRLRCLLILLAAAVGFGAAHICYQTKTVPAKGVDGQTLTVEAVAAEYPERWESYNRVEVNITSDNAPRLRAYVFSYDEEYPLPEITPGDTLSFTADFRAADTKRGEAYGLYNASGIYLLCYVQEGQIEVTVRSPTAFLYTPRVITNKLTAVADEVFTEDSAGFLKALSLGYRFDLNADDATYGAIKQSGIAHVVAVSGMHLAFLVGFLTFVLGKKKYAALICLPIIWLFAFMAGASPSVLRAALMQSAVLIAPLVGRENDAITSLSAALAILLLVNPDACASVSLQMSFAAMLGIVLITPRIYASLSKRISARRRALRDKMTKPKEYGLKLRQTLAAGFAASVGAQALALPLSALYFGYVPLYAIVVNLLILWAASLAFILGLLACVLGAVWLPLGVIVGYPASLAAKYIIAVAGFFSELPYAAVYTENILFGAWLILVYIIFALCWLLRGERGFRAVVPTCLSLCALCAVILVNELTLITGDAAFTAVDVGQGQSLVITDEDATVVIDCGGNDAFRNAGDITGAYLLSRGRRTVDVLALTHFDTDHVNGVTELMGSLNIRNLIIPVPNMLDETTAAVMATASKTGTTVYIISKDTLIEAGGIDLAAYVSVHDGVPDLMFRAFAGEGGVFVSGDADRTEELMLLYSRDLPAADVFVAGHHGSKYSNSEALLEALDARAAVVSCGYNTYGHPSDVALDRFASAGMRIMRTDEMGNVTIRLE